MFGLKRRKSVELVPFAQARPRLFNELLCDGVTAHNLPTFAELLALHARLQAEHPRHRVLASLDDLGQAGYTSGHGTEVHGLDDVEGHDLSRLGDLFEDGAHPGYLSTPAEFPIRLANLRRGAASVGLEQVRGELQWKTTGDANDPVTFNRDPEAALGIAREKGILFQFVPVESAADMIAAFPNGYFQGDLNPFQNHAVARYLEAEHGLALFGIGSRFLGFRRDLPLTDGDAHRLAAALCDLYADTPELAARELADLLTGRDWLLFRYTES
ncbi:hypothetical protein [Sphingomonas sp. MS122]|uniref:hypothetical protein n=1 Tax=Sphingomonas sp. MS122 TaxID=3412683 RepID=UPI003C2F729B